MASIGILGTGQAAMALASFMKSIGVSVILYNDRLHQGCLRYLSKKLIVSGLYDQELNMDFLVEDLEFLVKSCQVIFNVSPTYAHKRYYQLIAPFLSKDHLICNVTSNFTSLFVEEYLGESSMVCDINLSPFACRFTAERGLQLIGLKKKLYYSCLDPSYNEAALSAISHIFPSELACVKNVIEVGLKNLNGICHPAIMILNSGRIGENKQPFYFNKEGVSAAVSNVLTSLEKERIKICTEYGLAPSDFLTIMHEFYGEQFDSIEDFFISSKTLNAQKLCPKTIGGRYFEEDIGYLLVAWRSLAKYKNLETPALDALIQMASLLTNKNYFDGGRPLSAKKIAEIII